MHRRLWNVDHASFFSEATLIETGVYEFHSQWKSQQQMKEMTVCSITVNIYLFLFVTEV